VIIGALGSTELLIALLIFLVLFGGSQLPKLARSVGQAKRELKKAASEDDADPEGDASTA
jgi:sec-independent protein translocase protein TatA